MNAVKELPYSDGSTIKGIEYYRQVFNEVESIDFSNFSYDEMKRIIEKEKKIPLIHVFRPTLNFGNMVFHRIRKGVEFNEDKTLASSFGHPPPNKNGYRARANFSTDPVLYLSSLPQTACAECEVKIGDEIFISQWQFIHDRIGTMFYLGNREHMNQAWDGIINTSERIMNQKFSVYKQEVSSSLSFIYNRLISWFLKTKNYNLSSFLSHYCLYDSDGLNEYNYSVDCVLYASVAHDYRAFNLAIGKKSLNKIKLRSVIHGELQEITETGINMGIIGIGKCAGETIMWTNP